MPAGGRLCGHSRYYVPGVRHERVVRDGNVDGDGSRTAADNVAQTSAGVAVRIDVLANNAEN